MTTLTEGREEELWALLARRVRLWTGLDHTSVTAERAQHLLDSLLFTLSLGEEALQNGTLPAGAALPLERVFLLGRKRVDAKLRVARQLWSRVRSTLPPTDNLCCRETLVDGMAAFFRCYEPEFSAQEIHITCDYPLALPVERAEGVAFIEAYLERAYRENVFCACFPAQSLRQLWKRRGLGPDAVDNLFQPVLTCALGCLLLGEDPTGLSPSPAGVSALQQTLLLQPREAVDALAARGVDRLAAVLALEKPSHLSYLRACGENAAAALYHGIQNLTLARVLI